MPELLSKPYSKSRPMLLNLQIFAFFSSKQDFFCCKRSFNRILNGLPREVQTKMLRDLRTRLGDFLANSLLQKAYKNFKKVKASLPVPVQFR